jgi:succinate dehydrogenase/fumarate reductase flavoprotein subunit
VKDSKAFGEYNLFALREELRNATGKYLATIRSPKNLETLLSVIQRIKEQKRFSNRRTMKDLRNSLELDNVLLVSEAIARSALARKESRGAHIRYDYPSESDEMMYCHTYINKNGDVSFRHIHPTRNPGMI